MAEVGTAQAPALAAAMGDEGDLVAPRLARGCRAFAAWQGDRVVAYGWLSTGPEWIGELALEITPGRGEAYVWNCLTLSEHRLRGHFREVLLGIVAAATGEGLHRLWIGSLGGATPALVAAGFRPALEIRLASSNGLRHLELAAAPGADPALEAEARAVLGASHPVPFVSRRH